MLTVRSGLLLAAGAAAADVTVPTTTGPVIGDGPSVLSRCSSFYGVPYAAPPTGAKRFRPPQPHPGWTEPRPARRAGRSCLQGFGDGFVPLPAWAERLAERAHLGMEPMDEDCLYLNVFSPDVESTGLPAMVFFHGGSYLGGSGELQSGYPLYDGHILCSEGEVVVVTVNYRLGFFGFYASDELLQEEGTTGNMGIQDQRQALEWVRDNIVHFGGDPARVTIFGESAGAHSVLSHITSARSAPLFSAAIMQSGGFWPESLYQAYAESRSVTQAAQCDDLQCLRRVDAFDLLHAQLKVNFMASPVADGFERPLGVSLRDIVESGKFTAKPMIVGTNLNESTPWDCADVPQLDESAFRRRLQAMMVSQVGIPTDAEIDELTNLYNGSLYDDGHRDTWPWKRALIDVDTDITMFCDSRTILDAVYQQNQPSYAYVLDRTIWFFESAPCLGTPHTTDLFLLWQNFPFMTGAERHLGARMAKYWSSFAWNHTPGDAWPKFESQRGYLRLDAPVDRRDEQVKKANCDLFDRIRARRTRAIII